MNALEAMHARRSIREFTDELDSVGFTVGSIWSEAHAGTNGMGTCLAEARLNIADLLNKSRGDVAYTLLDTDAPIGPEVVVKLHAIPGVLSARLI